MPTPSFTTRKQQEAQFCYAMARECAERAHHNLTIQWQREGAWKSHLVRVAMRVEE